MNLDDLVLHTEKLVSENVELMEVNSKLSYDLEALKKHVELVIEHNSNVSYSYICLYTLLVI